MFEILHAGDNVKKSGDFKLSILPAEIKPISIEDYQFIIMINLTNRPELCTDSNHNFGFLCSVEYQIINQMVLDDP